MVKAALVKAEIRHRGVEPEDDYYLAQAADNNRVRLIVDGVDEDLSGKDVVLRCAARVGHDDVVEQVEAMRRFQYQAPTYLVDEAEEELANQAPVAPRRAQLRPPAGTRGRKSAGRQQPVAPATPEQRAAAAAAGHRGPRKQAGAESDEELLDDDDDDDDESTEVMELQARIRFMSGARLLAEYDAQLQAWMAAKEALKAGQQQQAASAAAARDNVLKEATCLRSQDVVQFLQERLQELDAQSSEQLEQLKRREAAAEQRFRLVERAVSKDPAALQLIKGSRARTGVLGYAVVAAVVAVCVALLQALYPQYWEAFKAALAGLVRK